MSVYSSRGISDPVSLKIFVMSVTVFIFTKERNSQLLCVIAVSVFLLCISVWYCLLLLLLTI
jgi:hypothetical protein